MADTMTLTAADGHRLQAYHVPAEGTARAGLVVVQEIFGVNDHIREVADGFAGDGYAVLAPALFDRVERGVELGYEAADSERGRALRAKIEPHHALMDIQACISELRGRSGLYSVGVVGYCWGGTLAWLMATRAFGADAAVCYYGGGIADSLDRKPRCPVLMHFGETDAMIPLADVDKIRAAFPDLPVHLYPAGHGFNCNHRASYHAESAELARSRTTEFLVMHLG